MFKKNITEHILVDHFSFKNDSIVYVPVHHKNKMIVPRSAVLRIINSEGYRIDPNYDWITFYSGEEVRARSFKILDREVAYSIGENDRHQVLACLIEFIDDRNGKRHRFSRCSDVIFFRDGSQKSVQNVTVHEDSLSFQEFGLNPPILCMHKKHISKLLLHENDKERVVDIATGFDLEKNLERHRSARNTFFYASVLSAGIGTYFMVSANHSYNSYKHTASSESAVKLREQIELYDKIALITYGVSIPLAVLTVTKHIKYKNTSKKLQMIIEPHNENIQLSLRLSL